MRLKAMTSLAVVLIAATFPAVAADIMMLEKGKSIMIGADGSMTMVPAMKGPMDPAVKKAAMPMDKCVLMMMGDDGKMYAVQDMKMSDGKMLCDAIKAM